MRRSPAFSILEILVALALTAMLAAIFIVSIPGMMDGLGSRPLPEILQKAVRDARYEAASRKELVSLRFDHERGAFLVIDQNGNAVSERASGFGADNQDVQVRFFQILPFEGVDSTTRGGDEAEVSSVRFHPDRSSTPFIAELEVDNVRSRHRFDPFSDLEIKDE